VLGVAVDEDGHVSITLIPHAGRYKAHCSHFMHKQLGMSDEIIVS
jgi:hypothetical protein